MAARGRRGPSLVVVVPALLLFGSMLVGAALVVRGNFEQGATAGRWVGSVVFLLASVVIVAALLREAIVRARRAASRRAARGAPTWRFTPRWKEELVCLSGDGMLVLEMMMLEPHVYFPTEDGWRRHAPDWATARRAELLVELERWCTAEGVALTVDERAWVAMQ